MNPVKFLIIGTFSALNKGDAALRIGTIYALEKIFPGSQYTIVSVYPDIDKKVYRQITIVKAIVTPLDMVKNIIKVIFWKFFGDNCNISINSYIINSDILKEYHKCDVIINAGGDTLSNYYSIKSNIFYFYHIILGKLFRKPVVIYAQSIGPFSLLKPIGKKILNNVDLITVRGETSYLYLKSIGVNNPNIFITADAAFLLPSCPVDELKIITKEYSFDKPPFIGFSISRLISKHYSSYDEFVELIASILDNLILKYQCTIILIPHVTGPSPELDDRLIHTQIFEKVKNKDKVKNILKDYNPQEIKGIIAFCDLFIGARMHACIAALSMGVPTINLAYHHKSEDVFAPFSDEFPIMKIQDISLAELLNQIDNLWINKNKIKERINKIIPFLNQKSLENAILIKEIININNN